MPPSDRQTSVGSQSNSWCRGSSSHPTSDRQTSVGSRSDSWCRGSSSHPPSDRQTSAGSRSDSWSDRQHVPGGDGDGDVGGARQRTGRERARRQHLLRAHRRGVRGARQTPARQTRRTRGHADPGELTQAQDSAASGVLPYRQTTTMVCDAGSIESGDLCCCVVSVVISSG